MIRKFSIHSISSTIGRANFGRSNNFGELLLLPLLLNSPALQPCLPLISWDLCGSRRFVTKDECPSGHQTWTPSAGSSKTFVCSRVGRCAWRKRKNIDRYVHEFYVLWTFKKLNMTYHCVSSSWINLFQWNTHILYVWQGIHFAFESSTSSNISFPIKLFSQITRMCVVFRRKSEVQFLKKKKKKQLS